MIYTIQTTNYVCPDQASIDEGKALGFNGDFSIGSETDAQALLTQMQNTLLTNNANLFSVNLTVVVADGVSWTAINLNDEPDNTDRVYAVFDPINGTYEQATGLANAKALFTEEQQSYLTFNNLQNYNSYNSWNDLPKPFKPIRTGTQTL